MSKTHSHSANALRLSVSMALAAGLTAGDVGSNVALAQDDESATEGRIQVTGSRIKRADIEGALPVTVIDRNQINLSGEISVADLIRNTNFNTFGSFRPQSGSPQQSFAGLSLRGLGTQRTLILIDGRRAPISPTSGNSQDLNTIPLAAVERIEILSDGASAIYGSDAIGGVVNVITRKDFNGAEFMYGQSAPKRPGGDTEEGSVIFGASSPNARVIGGASFNNRQIVWQRDRHWSAGGASSFSNNFLEAVETPGTLFGFVPGGFLEHPDNGSVVPGGCDAPSFTIVGEGADSLCTYDFTALAADEADLRNQSLFVRGHFQINDDWASYLNASVSRVKSFGRYAPVPSSPWPGGQPFLPTDSPNHPANRGFAGYDPDEPLFFRHRFAALGTRDNTIDSNSYDLLIGFEGRLGNVDLDTGVRQTEYQIFDLGRSYVVGNIAQARIESGEYDIYDPFGNDPDIMESMIATINQDSNFKQREAYISGSLDLFDMGGGIASTAFGVEYRKEEFADIFDTLQSSGQIVGSSGNSAAGDRNVKAAYFEVLLPVTPDLEVNVAGRYDNYSDYGSDFSPKLALRWQPRNDLTLRASYGHGFKAPTLDILTQQPSFGAATTAHPPTCLVFTGNEDCAPGNSTQVTTFSIANPDLASENSEQFSAGMAWEATDWFDMTLDYYNITIEDTVSFIGINTIWMCVSGEQVAACPPGLNDFSDSLFEPPDVDRGLGVAFGQQGQILFGQTGFANLGEIETSGLDFNGRTRFDLDGWGQVENQLALTYVNEFSTNGGPNAVGQRNFPKYRGKLNNTWSYGDFQVAWNLDYIHGQPVNDLPSWTVHHLQVNYHTPWNGRMTVGVRNIADKDPVVDPFDVSGRGFNHGLYDPYGRVPYFRYTQNF